MAIDGIGLDTWAVDFALLDESGARLDNRDPRTDGMIARVYDIIPRDELYTRTSIQVIQITTIYQLMVMKLADAPALRNAATFLAIAELLNYWLTGRKVVKFTSATCVQFYDPRANDCARDLRERLGIAPDMLPEVVQPGTVLGPLNVGLPELAGVNIPVIAVATHDTGSSVAAVPALEGER